ncbi:hypothetical protein ACFQDZ_09145 [Sulfitobacter pacificus]|uniref:hypothetical protein n=1 Tax=Sulfitobacter pacificus TaxID=1499314 RepID=UPI00360FDC75
MEIEFDALMKLPLDQLNFQLSPSLSAKNPGAVLDAMVAQTAAAQDDPQIDVQMDVPYGPRPRQKLDVFHPKAGEARLNL